MKKKKKKRVYAIVKTKNKKPSQFSLSNKRNPHPNIAQKWGPLGLGVKGIHRHAGRNRKATRKAADIVIR